eukprot:1143204-Pelagomonas_calceolata.AAC.4
MQAQPGSHEVCACMLAGERRGQQIFSGLMSTGLAQATDYKSFTTSIKQDMPSRLPSSVAHSCMYGSTSIYEEGVGEGIRDVGGREHSHVPSGPSYLKPSITEPLGCARLLKRHKRTYLAHSTAQQGATARLKPVVWEGAPFAVMQLKLTKIKLSKQFLVQALCNACPLWAVPLLRQQQHNMVNEAEGTAIVHNGCAEQGCKQAQDSKCVMQACKVQAGGQGQEAGDKNLVMN